MLTLPSSALVKRATLNLFFARTLYMKDKTFKKINVWNSSSPLKYLEQETQYHPDWTVVFSLISLPSF